MAKGQDGVCAATLCGALAEAGCRDDSPHGGELLFQREGLEEKACDAPERVRHLRHPLRQESQQGFQVRPATVGYFELLHETLAAFRADFPQIAVNLFDMTPAGQFRALELRKIDLGFIGLRPAASTRALQWERIARYWTVVVLPVKHPLARRREVSLGQLKAKFFVGMSEQTHPGFRDWLCATCRPAGFTPRILQDAELEPALMSLVAEGLGVTLGLAHIKKLPHPGVTFRPLSPPVMADYWIAWNRDNDSKALRQYTRIVKGLAAHTA